MLVWRLSEFAFLVRFTSVAALFIFGGKMIITFCGHSDYVGKQEDEEKILSLLTDLIGDSHAELYLGGYGSFDLFARACGKKYQQTHPNTTLIFVTAYITPSYQKTHLEYDKKLYDEIIYPELENVPPKFAISHRNKWMVERADYVIAYISRPFGGAYQTYKHAERKKKALVNIAENK